MYSFLFRRTISFVIRAKQSRLFYSFGTNGFKVREMSKQHYNVVFVLGLPGCGKGTQCLKIAKNLGYVHLSAGDLLRGEQNRPNSKYGSLIAEHIKSGTIVPVEITCKLLENAMENECGKCSGFLIDGFPRNQDNLEGWTKEMSSKTNVKFVLFIECPVDVCIQRCLSRGEGRADDNEVSLKSRIETYLKCTKPVIEFYEKQGLVRSVDGSKPSDVVFAEIQHLFENAA